MIKSILSRVIYFFYNIIFRPQVKSGQVSRNALIGKGARISEKVTIDANTEVGNCTFIGPYTSITKTQIGNYCSIGSFVKIGHGEHNLSRISTNTSLYGDSYDDLTVKPCEIGHDVWIGTDAIILRGVKIGNGAVIGANALVNKDVPDYAVAVGVPAKIIRKRFSDEKINIISQSQWWNSDLIEAQELIVKIEKEIE